MFELRKEGFRGTKDEALEASSSSFSFTAFVDIGKLPLTSVTGGGVMGVETLLWALSSPSTDILLATSCWTSLGTLSTITTFSVSDSLDDLELPDCSEGMLCSLLLEVVFAVS